MLDENQLEKLIKQLETAINSGTTAEPNHRKLFEQAIWTVENIDEAVRSQALLKGFLPSEGRIEATKIAILNSLCSQVSEAWETINDGSELEDLGERALNLACDALDKLNALS